MLNKQTLIQGGIIFLIAAVAATLVNVAQHYLLPSKAGTIMVLDTAGVMTAKQIWFTKELTKPGITDADRTKVFEQTKQFATDIDKALTKMQADCQCVIFDKGAVIIGNYVDVTETLKKQLNL